MLIIVLHILRGTVCSLIIFLLINNGIIIIITHEHLISCGPTI